MNRTAAAFFGICLVLGTSCGEEKTTNLGGLGQECDLSLDNLTGTDWVMNRILPGFETSEDNGVRLRVYEEGGELRALYNSGSKGDMYEFNCERRPADVFCRNVMNKDFLYRTCASLAVQGLGCTAEAILEFRPDADRALVDEAVTRVTEDMEKFGENPEENPEYRNYTFAHNNLTNILTFQLYLEVDRNTCEFMLTDEYKTLVKARDAAPSWKSDLTSVGRNNFVPAPENLFWGDCDEHSFLYARTETDFPDTPETTTRCDPPNCGFAVGDAVNFLYAGPESAEAEEGCTYSMDLVVDGVVIRENSTVEAGETTRGKSRLHWATAYSFTAPGPHYVAMPRNKTCAGGAEELVDVTCVPVLVR